MIRGMVRRLLALVIAVALLGTPRPAHAVEYFPETGHTLDARFLAAYQAWGGAPVLGLPISEAFYDESGLLLQYLENARLELLPGPETEGLQVRLAPLGAIIGGWDLPLETANRPPGSGAGCRLYLETKHQVCHAFLDYFLEHGGPEVLGYPISEFRLDGDRMVQYFERFRLDWHPEGERGEWVQPGALGRAHFALAGYDPALLDPRSPPPGATYQVHALRVQPSILKPLVTSEDVQLIRLVVRDQNLAPVQGAAVLLTTYLPDSLQIQMLPLTDAEGVTQAELGLEGQLPGSRIDLEFTVLFTDLSALARDSFYVWW